MFGLSVDVPRGKEHAIRRLVLAAFAVCTVVIAGCALHSGAVAGPKRPTPRRRVKVHVRSEPPAPRRRVKVYVQPAPPAPRVEVRTARPDSTRYAVWASGHWRWNGRRYVWLPGHWELKPRKDVEWVQGDWHNRVEKSGTNRYVWVAGRWKKTREHRVHRSDDGD